MVVRGLTKSFGDKVAVAGISLDVPRGSLYGLVGPNGAGKSTTIKMCTALLRPDAGDVWIDGQNVWADTHEAKRRLGVLPDDLPLFERLTGDEFLTFLGMFRGLDPDVVASRTAELLDVLDLTEAARVLVADYSTGLRKKISLPPRCCTARGCCSSTSRSSRSTRCRRARSRTCCAPSAPAAARWCCRATSWTRWNACAITWPS